jgi:hypothetical protein
LLPVQLVQSPGNGLPAGAGLRCTGGGRRALLSPDLCTGPVCASLPGPLQHRRDSFADGRTVCRANGRAVRAAIRGGPGRSDVYAGPANVLPIADAVAMLWRSDGLLRRGRAKLRVQPELRVRTKLRRLWRL